MDCPSCHKPNIPGDDHCAHCGNDLPAVDKVANHFGDSLGDIPVSTLAYHPAVSVNIDETVASAIKRMVEQKRGETVVWDHGKLAGIFTERDLIYRVLEPGLDPKATRIADVMTHAVETLCMTDPVALALHRMAMIGCRHMPIMDGETCVGVVSVRNILTFFAGHIQD